MDSSNKWIVRPTDSIKKMFEWFDPIIAETDNNNNNDSLKNGWTISQVT